MSKLLVDADWLANQYPQYEGDALKYILEFPEVELFTPQQEITDKLFDLLQRILYTDGRTEYAGNGNYIHSKVIGKDMQQEIRDTLKQRRNNGS